MPIIVPLLNPPDVTPWSQQSAPGQAVTQGLSHDNPDVLPPRATRIASH